MTKNVNGFMLVDAPHSALNNAGMDAGERTDNIVRVKTIRRGRDVYPYVSGQALRYWWRDTLGKKFGWKLSPVKREKKVAFTEANPVEYDDDDVFGYMRALKKEDGGTVTRISPLKNSPLMSVIPQRPTSDFGVMARQDEGDPVPYEHEFYSTVLKSIFSLDLDYIGVFHEKEKTGYKNMYPELMRVAKKNKAKQDDGKWIMPKKVRQKRAMEVIKALPYLSGGAKLTPHLTDVSPKLILLTVLDCGNHIFMNLAQEEDGKPTVSIDAFNQVVEDYSDNILTDIYIGRREGFMDDLDGEFKSLVKEHSGKENKVVYGSVNDIVDGFVEEIKSLMS